MSAIYFDIAAESARRQRDIIARKVDAARQIPIIDYTEPWMHDVHGAINAFDKAIEHTLSESRLTQLAERAASFSAMWDEVFEKARDKSAAVKAGQL